MGTVIVLGSLITDLVARAPRLPYPGESLIGDDFGTFLGGKGVNQAVAARRLGSSVTLVGRVGSDTFGDAFFPVLMQEEINSTYVERDTTIGTGVSVLVISDSDGQNIIVANPRANFAVPAETVITAIDVTLQAQTESNSRGVFLTQCETSNSSYVAGLQHARAAGMITILNAAPIPRETLSDELFALVDILIVNEVEAANLAQSPVSSIETAQVASEVLLKRGSRHVLITLGAQGCLWSHYDQEGQALTPFQAITHQVIPPFPVKAVDATAAGDTFCGALAARLADSQPLAQALRWASAASGVTVTRKGAISAIPTSTEVEALLAETPAAN